MESDGKWKDVESLSDRNWSQQVLWNPQTLHSVRLGMTHGRPCRPSRPTVTTVTPCLPWPPRKVLKDSGVDVGDLHDLKQDMARHGSHLGRKMTPHDPKWSKVCNWWMPTWSPLAWKWSVSSNIDTCCRYLHVPSMLCIVTIIPDFLSFLIILIWYLMCVTVLLYEKPRRNLCRDILLDLLRLRKDILYEATDAESSSGLTSISSPKLQT